MQVLVKYTEEKNAVNYEAKNEAAALQFAEEEAKWENTEWVKIPDLDKHITGDFH